MKHLLMKLRPALLMFLLVACVPLNGWAHCDTLSGPVIKDARLAIANKDVTPVLKWVGKADEKEIRHLFDRTLAVRGQSADAKNLADMHFFETLVRIHRAGEGAPYTGLKAADIVEPAIALTDESIAKGSADKLLQGIGKKLDEAIRARLARVMETKKHANDSVEAGREFVEAYVDYLHFVESLDTVLTARVHFDHGNEIKSLEGKDKR